MIKLVYCVRKRSGMADAEFYDYWLNTHGSIACKLAALQGVRKYVQSHALNTELNAGLRASRGMAAPYEGIAELWWDDLESLERDFSSTDLASGFEELLKDEAQFIDFSQSCAFVTKEHRLYEDM